MTDFKKEWTVESALQVVRHPTVDSRLWSEAVEWLMLYGPPEMREMLGEASNYATSREFPTLKPSGFTEDGRPVYAVAEIASMLGLTEEEAAEIIAAKEEKHGRQHLYGADETKKLQ